MAHSCGALLLPHPYTIVLMQLISPFPSLPENFSIAVTLMCSSLMFYFFNPCSITASKKKTENCCLCCLCFFLFPPSSSWVILFIFPGFKMSSPLILIYLNYLFGDFLEESNNKSCINLSSQQLLTIFPPIFPFPTHQHVKYIYWSVIFFLQIFPYWGDT